jgi:hypothetical protein
MTDQDLLDIKQSLAYLMRQRIDQDKAHIEGIINGLPGNTEADRTYTKELTDKEIDLLREVVELYERMK